MTGMGKGVTVMITRPDTYFLWLILARRKLLQRFQKPGEGDRFNFNGAAVWRLGRGLRYVLYMIKYIVSGHWWACV